jgi:hypothetical protein
VPSIWPRDLGVIGVEAVDVEVFHAVRLLGVPLAVEIVQGAALAQGDQRESVTVVVA